MKEVFWIREVCDADNRNKAVSKKMRQREDAFHAHT